MRFQKAFNLVYSFPSLRKTLQTHFLNVTKWLIVKAFPARITSPKTQELMDNEFLYFI